MFLGPPLGEWISETFGNDTAWVLAGGLAMLAASTGIVAPGAPTEPPPKPERRVLLHRAALRPGAVLFLGLLGYTGFLAFAALHAEEVGIANTGTVSPSSRWSSSSSGSSAAKLPDQLGPIRTSRISLSCGAVGLAVLAVWTEPVGVYVGAAILAVAQSFLFPALFAFVVDDAPDAERSHAISTLSMFFDLAFGLGGPVIGLVSDTFDRSTALCRLRRHRHLRTCHVWPDPGDITPSISVREIGPRSRR